jgi:glycerol-3-phosphate dehydrogenase
VEEPKAVAVGPGSALHPLLDQEVIAIARAGSVSEETARGMMEWHGQHAMDIAHTALAGADLRTPICPHTSHIVAEVVDAYQNQYAVTLGDVLLRRVPLALGACWSDSCSREATLRIGAVMGWNEQESGANLEQFESERAAFLKRPAFSGSVLEAAADSPCVPSPSSP